MRADLYTGPVPQSPPYPARYGRNLLSAAALAVVFGYAAQVVELRPLELLRDLGNIGVFLKGYLHPSFRNLHEYAWQCLVTVCIALWGTVLPVTRICRTKTRGTGNRSRSSGGGRGTGGNSGR